MCLFIYLFIYLFHSYLASKNRDNGKNRRKVTMRLMVRLNLSSDDVRNCKKRILDLVDIQEYLKNPKSKEHDKFTSGKTRKSIQNSKRY